MTDSQTFNKSENKIYQWIEMLQNDPQNEEVQEELVKQYTPLVKSLAGKYAKNPFIHEDLVQVGMIGLLGAIRRYDASFGHSFEAFAVPTILGEIKRFIRDKTWSVHVPRRIKELGPKIRKIADELTLEKQKSPTITEIAHRMDVSEEEILETLELGQGYHALSADREVEADRDGGTVSLLDIIGEAEDGYEQIDIQLLLEKILPTLEEREQKIIKYIFFENMSQRETGKLLGMSQMHVSRIQRRALRKLRKVLTSKQQV